MGNEHVAEPFRGILDAVLTANERSVLAGHEQMRAELADLRVRNERMRGFIQRLGYGHTDWPDQKIGCERPGPGCVPHCMSRCSNVDHLNATVYDLRADLDRLRAVWRAVAMRWEQSDDLPYAVVDAAIAAGLAEYDLACPPDGARKLTPAGQRLARGGA